MVHIGNDWDELLRDEFQKEYYQRLRRALIVEYRTRTIYPDMYDIFNALKATPYHACKVVLLGQDPYHGPGQAHGPGCPSRRHCRISSGSCRTMWACPSRRTAAWWAGPSRGCCC